MDYHDYIEYSKVDILEVNEYKSDSSSVESRVKIDDDYFAFTKSYDGYDSTNDNDLDDGDEYQVSTAISKLQIKLNVLTNKHKASIKLYNISQLRPRNANVGLQCHRQLLICHC
mgnify:CR=1 FL=1